MKKLFGVLMGVSMISAPAFATKARLIGLGQNKHNSSVVADERNMFASPQYINRYKDFAVMEWGASASTDADTTPRAEGGYFKSMGKFAWGVYLGDTRLNEAYTDVSTTRNSLGRSAAGGFLEASNAVDLFFGGQAGVEWGLRFTYADQVDTTGPAGRWHNAMALALGVTTGNLELSLNTILQDESTGQAAFVSTEDAKEHKYEGKTSYDLGVTYNMGDNVLYASWKMGGFDYTHRNANALGDVEEKSTGYTLGFGRAMKVNKSATVFTDVNYTAARREKSRGVDASSTNATVTRSDASLWKLPVTIGVEAEATSWLTLRGAVSQNIFGREGGAAANGTEAQQWEIKDGRRTIRDTTTVSAGATLSWDKLKLDGVIGSDTASTGARTAGGKTGVLSTSDLMTRVAMSYWF